MSEANWNFFQSFALAKQQHRSGALAEAEAAYRRLIEVDSTHGEVWHFLGVVLMQLGRVAEAIGPLERATALRPGDAAFRSNLGSAYRAVGRLNEAAQCFEGALSLQPDLLESRNSLGATLRDLGRFDAAIACFRQAVLERPDDAASHANLASTLRVKGELNLAETTFRRAIELSPDFAAAYVGLGQVLRQNDKQAEAVRVLRQAVKLAPDLATAHTSLGTALLDAGEGDEAISTLQHAHRLDPREPTALNNLGLAFSTQWRLDEAITCYQQALRLKPDCTDAHYNLALALGHLGHMDQAQVHYQAVLDLAPTDRCRIVGGTMLPPIYESREHLMACRAQLVDNLARLNASGAAIELTRAVGHPLFYLAYQGLDDRDVQRDLARLHQPPSSPSRDRVPASSDDRIRIGFISRHFHNHTIGELMAGLIANLSRDAFQVTVFSAGRRDDEIARSIRQSVDRYVELPEHPGPAREAILAVPLDVLFYTDIGMDPLTHALAFSRLAPLQCTTWGHPETTGIPAIDYYLSSELFETPTADAHYTERLVRLKGIAAWCRRPQLPGPLKPRSAFGISDDLHVYACPQSLFKFHPDFDFLLEGILERDPLGVLMLVEARNAPWTRLLKDRLIRRLPQVHDRVKWLPRLSHDDFLQLCATSDVLLDTPHFNGGNTSYKAFAFGTPIVTLPSEFMRGRMTYGMYRKMDYLDCVAKTPEEYIALAVRLGTEREFRDATRAAILDNCGTLYEDVEVVREIEAFLRAAVHLEKFE